MRTNDHITAVYAEFDAQPPGPKLMLGDLNGAVQAEDFIDLGNCPGVCCTLAQRNSHMQQQNSHTRRDSSFANPAALPFISSFRVFDDYILPTHSAFVLTIKVAAQMPSKTVALKPHCIYDTFCDAIRAKHNIGDGAEIFGKIFSDERATLRNLLDKHCPKHRRSGCAELSGLFACLGSTSYVCAPVQWCAQYHGAHEHGHEEANHSCQPAA